MNYQQKELVQNSSDPQKIYKILLLYLCVVFRLEGSWYLHIHNFYIVALFALTG